MKDSADKRAIAGRRVDIREVALERATPGPPWQKCPKSPKLAVFIFKGVASNGSQNKKELGSGDLRIYPVAWWRLDCGGRFNNQRAF